MSLQIAPDGSHPTLVTIKCSCGAFHSTLSPSAACTKSVCLLCVSPAVCLLPQSLHRLTRSAQRYDLIIARSPRRAQIKRFRRSICSTCIYVPRQVKQETRLSLTNRATHLCKRNGVADPLKYTPLPMCVTESRSIAPRSIAPPCQKPPGFGHPGQ